MWRGAASAQQQPDRGEHEHLVHHLDVEELVHHLDVGAVNSGHHLAVEELVHHLNAADAQFSSNGCRCTFFPNVALSSEQSPQTPAYASTQ